MPPHDANSKTALGFLTVVEHQQYGLFGGYLLLNPAGRPLEFHCTAPIKPNRAQQILYGPTLESFLYGEQIGRTLLEKAKIEPSLVCTDRQPALAARQHLGSRLAPRPLSGPDFRAGLKYFAVSGSISSERYTQAPIRERIEDPTQVIGPALIVHSRRGKEGTEPRQT